MFWWVMDGDESGGKWRWASGDWWGRGWYYEFGGSRWFVAQRTFWAEFGEKAALAAIQRWVDAERNAGRRAEEEVARQWLMEMGGGFHWWFEVTKDGGGAWNKVTMNVRAGDKWLWAASEGRFHIR